ncbi:hypothetical protein DW765_15270 [Phocaeicola vulgatus]|uniref:Uncharacterized protein n=1 Tax=Bacteroides uniformis TaxID=820 RepID=A0A414IEX2_BACUN|nr:hypothetical protein GAQ36_19415 [Bacteroides uniformis]RHE14333.1 hypothetical protein DW765_15270 [Phocaeicola vulgatus]KAB4120132.1 hypothetical protein GAQ50_19675 [Bacteroides uniformis]KAB4124683.1 hypothetical protein GAQ33_19755 [Bacteroides uniformis]KAB4130626.1 hypothetical protein GAQ40_19540 [Bacteroides uniformis]
MNVAQQSDEGGFSVQANRASCVLVRQKVFCPTRTNLPAPGAGESAPKSRILEKKKSTNQQSHALWRKQQGQGQAGNPRMTRRTASTASA